MAPSIIDEGIQYTHPDLDANAWTNPEEPVDGRDNDGNGYVDDVRGWDFVRNDSTVYDGGKKGTQDKHGTHVAGTIAGEGGNGTGVVGVNWNVTYISCKFLGPNGGTLANAIEAVDYVTDLKVRHGLNIVATNNSWGGGGFSQALLDAITRGAEQNILFVAAAVSANRKHHRSLQRFHAQMQVPDAHLVGEDAARLARAEVVLVVHLERVRPFLSVVEVPLAAGGGNRPRELGQRPLAGALERGAQRPAGDV